MDNVIFVDPPCPYASHPAGCRCQADLSTATFPDPGQLSVEPRFRKMKWRYHDSIEQMMLRLQKK
jgi:hypothetical protein